MAQTKVYNKAMNSIEAGGEVWPARRETSANLSKENLAQVEAHPKLIVGGKPKPEAESSQGQAANEEAKPEEASESDG